MVNKFIKIRIRQDKNGWIVEIQVSHFFVFKKWTHLLGCFGIPEDPFYFSSAESAETSLINDIRRNLKISY